MLSFAPISDLAVSDAPAEAFGEITFEAAVSLAATATAADPWTCQAPTPTPWSCC